MPKHSKPLRALPMASSERSNFVSGKSPSQCGEGCWISVMRLNNPSVPDTSFPLCHAQRGFSKPSRPAGRLQLLPVVNHTESSSDKPCGMGCPLIDSNGFISPENTPSPKSFPGASSRQWRWRSHRFTSCQGRGMLLPWAMLSEEISEGQEVFSCSTSAHMKHPRFPNLPGAMLP